MTTTRRPWRKCGACTGTCHWHDTDWVCEDCGSEWSSDHDPKYAAPGSQHFYASIDKAMTERYGRRLYVVRERGKPGYCAWVAGKKIASMCSRVEAQADADWLNSVLG